jgi:OOP family OmpA-OmpF porin
MLKRGLLLIAATAVSVSAFAGENQTAVANQDDGHFYVGAQAGYVTHYGFKNEALTTSNGKANITTQYATYAKDHGSFGARAYVGYMFNKYIGLELGGGTFGSQTYSYDSSLAQAKADPAEMKTTALMGFDADMVGHLPLTQNFFAFAKAGMAYVDFKTKPLFKGGYDFGGKASSSHWNWMPRAEMGLGYNLTQNLALTASYSYYIGLKHATRLPTETGVVTNSDLAKFAPSFGVAAVGLTYSF